MEKTEPPSPRRLKKARAAGDVPITPLAARAVGLLVLALVGPSAARVAVERFGTSFRAALAPVEGAPLDPHAVASSVAIVAFPALGAMTVAALAVGLAQSGGALSLPRAEGTGRAPRTLGLRRLLDEGRLASLVVGTLTAAALLALAGRELLAALPRIAALLDRSDPALAVAGDALSRVLLVSALVVAVFAALDWFVRRALWLRRLRMSRTELRQERRDEEGSPELRRARRRLHEEL